MAKLELKKATVLISWGVRRQFKATGALTIEGRNHEKKKVTEGKNKLTKLQEKWDFSHKGERTASLSSAKLESLNKYFEFSIDLPYQSLKPNLYQYKVSEQ